MRHLTDSELVDATESEVEPRVAAHLAACDRCRRRVDDLAATRLLAADVDEPEPSPLFWPAFAARVSAAVREGAVRDEGRVARAWQPRWRWAAASVAAALLVGSAAAVIYRSPGSPATAPQVASYGPELLGSVLEPGDMEDGPLAGDATWLLVAEIGAEVDWDAATAAGFGPVPGSAEGAVEDLTTAERGELARLLELALAGEPF